LLYYLNSSKILLEIRLSAYPIPCIPPPQFQHPYFGYGSPSNAFDGTLEVCGVEQHRFNLLLNALLLLIQELLL